MSSYIESRYYTPEVASPEPDCEQYIDLSPDSKLHMQSYISPWGFAGVVGHWGVDYSKERVDSIVEQNFGEDYVIPSVGFGTVWKVPHDYSFKRAIEDELEVASRLIGEALALNRLTPEDIEYLFLGSGSPLVDHPDIDRYGVTLAELNGLEHLDPESDIYDKYLACHSGYKNIRDALLDPRFNARTCLFVNMEGLTRLMPDITPENCDPLSPYFFGNGGNAFVMVPGETLKLVRDEEGMPIEEERIVPDTRGALSARVPYEHLYDEEYLDPESGNIVQSKDNIELIALPTPQEGG
jgi:hypothetical protein